MANFALIHIEDIPDEKIPFFKLAQNDSIQLDESWEKLQKNGYEKNLDAVQTIIYRKATQQPVPPKQFEPLGKINKNDPYEAFEIRKNRIRIYGFIVPDIGYVLYDAHIKDSKKQKKMLQSLSRIMNEYYQEINNN